MNYKQIGDVGQNCAIGDLSKFGLGIAFPLSDNFPFDFIIIAGNKLFRAQVKSSSQHINGGVYFGIKSNSFYSGETKAYSEEDVDVVICYDLRDHKTYILVHKDIKGQKAFTIRFTPTKNNQTKNCHWHEKYILSKERVKEVFDFDVPVFEDFFGEMNRLATQYPHVCEECGKDFINGSKNSKCCGAKCSKKSQRKVERPAKEELQHLIEITSWVQIGKKYGVSDNTIRKWAKGYGILGKGHGRGYWAKLHANKLPAPTLSSTILETEKTIF